MICHANREWKVPCQKKSTIVEYIFVIYSDLNNESSKQYLSGHVMMIYCDKTKRGCCQEFPQKSLVLTMRPTKRVTMLAMVDEAPERSSLSFGLHSGKSEPSVTLEVSQST